MRFQRLDLNLLVALNVLIEERSVSAAAKRLNLSQPAVSGALNRLREFFDDELLVQSGRQMVLSAKAQELADPVRDALMLIRTRITTPVQFDPSTAERTFRIIASDYVYTVLLADVMAHAAVHAPNIGFEIVPPELRTTEMLERGEADLLVTLESYVTMDQPTVKLFSDVHAAICWSGSVHSGGIDEAAFHAADHAIAYFGPARIQSVSESFFAQQGIERNVEVWVPSFTMLPQAVVGTDRIATMQKRYADYWARILPITVLPVPIETPPIEEVAQWHVARDKDQGIKWLVDQLKTHSEHLATDATEFAV